MTPDDGEYPEQRMPHDDEIQNGFGQGGSDEDGSDEDRSDEDEYAEQYELFPRHRAHKTPVPQDIAEFAQAIQAQCIAIVTESFGIDRDYPNAKAFKAEYEAYIDRNLLPYRVRTSNSVAGYNKYVCYLSVMNCLHGTGNERSKEARNQIFQAGIVPEYLEFQKVNYRCTWGLIQQSRSKNMGIPRTVKYSNCHAGITAEAIREGNSWVLRTKNERFQHNHEIYDTQETTYRSAAVSVRNRRRSSGVLESERSFSPREMLLRRSRSRSEWEALVPLTRSANDAWSNVVFEAAMYTSQRL